MSSAPWEPTISEEIILELYASRMEKFGGDASPPKPNCLQQCLGGAWTAEGYYQPDDTKNVRPGIIFAAYLFYYLAHDHCFVDGNKRIAWSAMAYVIAQYGLTINATTDEAYTFVIQVVEKQVDREEVALWIAERLETLQ